MLSYLSVLPAASVSLALSTRGSSPTSVAEVNLYALVDTHHLWRHALWVFLKALSLGHYFFLFTPHLWQNSSSTQCFPTAVRRWHTTLCYSVFYKSSRQYYKTSVMSVLTSPLVLQKRYGAKPNQIRRHSLWHTSKAQICIRPSVNVANSVIQLSGSVKILGATLDPSLTMGPHTKTLSSKSCFYHIRSFRQIALLWIILPPFLWPWL